MHPRTQEKQFSLTRQDNTQCDHKANKYVMVMVHGWNRQQCNISQTNEEQGRQRNDSSLWHLSQTAYVSRNTAKETCSRQRSIQQHERSYQAASQVPKGISFTRMSSQMCSRNGNKKLQGKFSQCHCRNSRIISYSHRQKSHWFYSGNPIQHRIFQHMHTPAAHSTTTKCHSPPWDVKFKSMKRETYKEHGHITVSTDGSSTHPMSIKGYTTVTSSQPRANICPTQYTFQAQEHY